VPAVSLATLVEPRTPNAVNTIPFKNVLDGLDASETPGDESTSGEQKPASPGTISKVNGASAGKTVPDPTPGLPQRVASQHSTPQIPYPNQNLAQLAATPANPTQKIADPQEKSSASDAAASESSEPAGQDHTESTSPSSQRASVPSASAPANSAPAKFSTTEAKIIAVPAQLVSGVSTSKSPAGATPAVTKPVTAAAMSYTPPESHTPVEARPTTPSHTAPSAGIAQSQPKSTPVIAPEATVASSAPGGAANPPAVKTVQAAAAVTPQNTKTSVDGSVPDELSKARTEPAALVPGPKELARNATPAQAPVQPQTSPARTQIAEPARPVTAPPLPTPTAPLPIAPVPTPATTKPASTRIAPTAATSLKPTDTSSRPVAPPDSAPSDSSSSSGRETRDQSGTPKQAASSIDSAAAPAVTPAAPIPALVAENTTSTPETPKSSVAARSQDTESTAAATAPKAPLAPTADNFAFAVRMVSPDATPLTQAKPAVTPTEPQISQPKAADTQPKPAPAPQQQPQSEASSNSKRETQSPASDTEKSDTRAPKPADLPQSGPAQEAVTRWSEVSAGLQPSEPNAAPLSSELVEPTHASPALAAQETHLMAPELPKTSSSTDILLHLTGNDQSSAAIRVADRGGSVNVSVHAADPVLRESLRSNLGELSTQLSQQGWRADVLKPAATAAPSDSQQDSHQRGQGSSQQQQSSGGDRQPQRDRRAQGGHWKQELEQQISGGNAHPGGNG
jgi:hypothetical protein